MLEIHLKEGSIVLQGNSLMVGNEYSNEAKSCVFLEDISSLQDSRLKDRISEIKKGLEGGLRELLEVAIEVYENEPMVEGRL